jgi:predicted transcriptional regulator
MPNQPIPDRPTKASYSDEHLDCEVLHLMLHDHPSPWSLEELARELDDETNAADAVDRLQRAGLVHRLGDFVIPTRTARRAAQLQLGTA